MEKMVERLSGETLLISLIATPIRHSMSPTMHNAAFVKSGLDYAYVAFEVGDEELEDAVQGIRALGIRGSNVSMPNKQTILPHLDEISPAAEMVGAVNTVVNKDGKGHLVGHITDGTGCMEALRQEGVEVKDKIITLAGAGGAGTAIAIQAALDGVKELRIFNINDKHFENGKETVKKVNNNTECKATLTDLVDQDAFKQSLAESDIYIDATSVGMKPLENHKLIDDPDAIREDLVIYDVVYNPDETELLKFARENGVKKTYNGLGMMLYQGAEAFKLFTDEDMPVDYIRDLLFDGKE
jgi:shikimate dehydrogenase